MASSSRQERQQMRQRGAAARKINNIDFGFSFNATPRPVRHSTRTTPQSGGALFRRNSKTPVQSARPSSTARSLRSNSVADVSPEPQQAIGQGHANDDVTEGEGSSNKRRKISDDENTPLPVPAFPLVFTAPPQNLRSPLDSGRQRRSSANPAFIISVEQEDHPSELPQSNLINLASLVHENNDAQASTDHDADKENEVSEARRDEADYGKPKIPKQKPKKRKSIGQRRKKRSSTGSLIEAEARGEESGSEAEAESGPVQAVVEITDTLLAQEDSEAVATEEDAATIRNESHERQESGSEQISGTSAKLLAPALGGFHEGDGEGEEREATQESIDMTIPRELSDSIEDPVSFPEQRPESRNTSTARTTRRRTSDSSFLQTPAGPQPMDVEPEGDDTYIDDTVISEEHTPRVPTKKARNKSKADQALPSIKNTTSRTAIAHRTSQKRSSSHEHPGPQRKSLKRSFPIQTYRLANVSALPTIDEEIENDADSTDDLLVTRPHLGGTGDAPNAVDILAQICRETMETAVSKLSSMGNSTTTTSRAELKRKRSTIDAFREELEVRLFDVSAAVENRMTLEARVKKSRRQKAELQARWREVRRSREEVALKCDHVRKQHWDEEAKGQQNHELSERLHGLEMAVDMEQDGDGEAVGLEFALATVARDVSSAAGGGGLLDRIKDFNRQLERTVLLL